MLLLLNPARENSRTYTLLEDGMRNSNSDLFLARCVASLVLAIKTECHDS